MKLFDLLAYVLVIIGALNWGLVGLFHFDLVGFLFAANLPMIQQIIYVVVGLAGVYVAYLMAKAK